MCVATGRSAEPVLKLHNCQECGGVSHVMIRKLTAHVTMTGLNM
jgi:hypothetical protein